ncbi:hypothetical protein GTQ43_20580 [Nostoc sp. KVJ3]|uniref:hypothetical protein n=1 Tax=Nostoc sp. KVJ3 TaxID=457945 RepID=UPI00223878FF|nr:hypothetical protein [Nostoc sp. KVJ3]MCW5316122.1 hypothetical protein [Nostoc sp. KVJ3]
MAATPDLTLVQVHDKCTNSEVKAYIASMPSLPIGIKLCEFLSIFMQACAVAQIEANKANGDSLKKGNALDSYSLPVTGTVQTDATNNIQFFTSVYKMSIVTAVNNGCRSVPTYI